MPQIHFARHLSHIGRVLRSGYHAWGCSRILAQQVFFRGRRFAQGTALIASVAHVSDAIGLRDARVFLPM